MGDGDGDGFTRTLLPSVLKIGEEEIQASQIPMEI